MLIEMTDVWVNDRSGATYLVKAAKGVYDDDTAIVVTRTSVNFVLGKLYVLGGYHAGDGASFVVTDKEFYGYAELKSGARYYIFRRRAGTYASEEIETAAEHLAYRL